MFARTLTISLGFLMILTALPLGMISEQNKTQIFTNSIDFNNNDQLTLWVRKNGSDPDPFGYSGTNVSPYVGINFFKTKSLIVKIDSIDSGDWTKYSWAELNNTNLFPADATIWVYEYPSVLAMNAVADHALYDSRIRGFIWDDFPVGQESPANMSAIYSALHHEDANLTNDLNLSLVVYNRNYFKQSPHPWSSIESYFDILNFWFYPTAYQYLWNGLLGYTDDFKTLQSWMPEKEYWCGLYLHYYNIGSFPLNFTKEILNKEATLLKQKNISRINILENFWIQHNSETAQLVIDFFDNEYNRDYETDWYMPYSYITYESDSPIYPPKIYDVGRGGANIFQGWTPECYQFTSSVFQNLSIYNSVMFRPTPTFQLINIRTGEHQLADFDYVNEIAHFTINAGETYRVQDFHFTAYIEYYSDQHINVPTSWIDKHITINGMVFINSTLTIERSIIRFGNNNFDDSIFNHTTPAFGIKMMTTDNAVLDMWSSVIEPTNRYYPYVFNRTWDTLNGSAQVWTIDRSYISGYWDIIRPAGIVYFTQSTFAGMQPSGGNFHMGLRLEGTNGYIDWLILYNNVVWNYPYSGSVGVFLMPGYLVGSRTQWDSGSGSFIWPDEASDIILVRNMVIGFQYSVWVDMSYSRPDSPVTFQNSTIDCFIEDNQLSDVEPYLDNIEIRLDGPIDSKVIIETTADIPDSWSVKGSTPGPLLTIYWPYADNGVYTLTTDASSNSFTVTTHSIEIGYGPGWRASYNNFTLAGFTTLGGTPESTITNLIWLLIVFLIPVAMVQAIPKIGFIIGMSLILLIIGFAYESFFPYMLVCFFSLGVYVYKGM